MKTTIFILALLFTVIGTNHKAEASTSIKGCQIYDFECRAFVGKLPDYMNSTIPKNDGTGLFSIKGNINTAWSDFKKERELRCLAISMYGEARGEGEEGMKAVRSVLLNRVKSKRYPDSICKVSTQKVGTTWQFSFWENKKFLSISKAVKRHDIPNFPGTNKFPDQQALQLAKVLAYEVINNPDFKDPTNGATHFIAPAALNRVPIWASILKKTATINGHVFFVEN